MSRFSQRKSRNFCVGAAVGALMLGVSLVAIPIAAAPTSQPTTARSKLFYTADDGATTFVDDAGKVPPFEHEGKPAAIAHVFVCKKVGTPFVGYMERIPPAVKNVTGATTQPEMRSVIATDTAREIKRPGDTRWVLITDATANAIREVHCPDDSIVEEIFPPEHDIIHR